MYTIVPFASHRPVRHNPMGPLFDDRFFRSFFDLADAGQGAGFRVDVQENPQDYVLSAELPGVKPEDIHVQVENDTLTVEADMNMSREEERGRCLYSERRSGHMRRSFSLDGIAQEAISAGYDNGLLRVTLPKKQPEPEKAVRQIPIEGIAPTAEESDQA